MCNEIDGQKPPAYAFAKRMYEEAKRLDPRRLVTYASNSLQKSPEKDVSGLMDYIMWNEYYESWYDGSPESLARNLNEIHRAFPDKAIVISEYGYCACTPERPEGDAKRGEVLRNHNKVRARQNSRGARRHTARDRRARQAPDRALEAWSLEAIGEHHGVAFQDR
jgi:beta-glucuronidase